MTLAALRTTLDLIEDAWYESGYAVPDEFRTVEMRVQLREITPQATRLPAPALSP